MFISVRELYKIGVGPSSSHTTGPMLAANDFRHKCEHLLRTDAIPHPTHITCTLRGSLAYTGKGHASDRAIALGLHGYTPVDLVDIKEKQGRDKPEDSLRQCKLHFSNVIGDRKALPDVTFSPVNDIIFDRGPALPQHPNGLVFQLKKCSADGKDQLVLEETYFSIGGGFICTLAQMTCEDAILTVHDYPYAFNSASSMLAMAKQAKLSIGELKRANETVHQSNQALEEYLDTIWRTMRSCVEAGIAADGELPGGLAVKRRAKKLYQQLSQEGDANHAMCTYAMAVNEENASGNTIVTAPTNGAAGVVPAILYYIVKHRQARREDIHNFLLTSAAIGGLIKHRSSISGAEVGCQGEVGSASAMAAAGLCAVLGGSPEQVENAAEMALEHHLGLTCDPVKGLVQVPCIERNGFGAIKAYTAANLAMLGDGLHLMSLDNCIHAMKETGDAMSSKYKETSQGGLAVSYTEC